MFGGLAFMHRDRMCFGIVGDGRWAAAREDGVSRSVAVLTTCVAFLVIAISSAATQDWDRAERDIRRLPPSAFPQLPSALRIDLERRGCRIPQPSATTGSGNVIRGRFTSPAQMDWAVLCSIGGSSSILVFRGESVADVAELHRAPDRNYLQTGAHTLTIEYSRTVQVASPSFIRSRPENRGPGFGI